MANPWCKVVIPTGLGQARNALVVLSGLGAIAVGGEAGTLSEIGFALKNGRPLVGPGLLGHTGHGAGQDAGRSGGERCWGCWSS